MTNRILDAVVLNHRLDPHESELHVHLLLEGISPATEIKGRVTGPRCALSSTIEIAYSLREIERSEQIVMRAVIPESSWWEPETPFLYDVTLELWEDGQRCERMQIKHGIRRLQLTSKGLLVNGQPLRLIGKVIGPTWSEADAQAQRQAGFNSILTSDLNAWSVADRIGFLVLGFSDELNPFLEFRTDLLAHASHLGWVFNRDQIARAPLQQEGSRMFYGVNTSTGTRPENADFLVCHERELAWLDGVEAPKIVIVETLPRPLPDRADVMGWIEGP